jgi:hypothetical protein
LTEARLSFLLADTSGEMVEKESKLTVKYSLSHQNGPGRPKRTLYASEPQLIALCRNNLSVFTQNQQAHPGFPVALYHK